MRDEYGDIHPDNLVVTADLSGNIHDVGLAMLPAPPAATAADDPTMAPATDAGTVLGTVGYMAPEQLRAQPIDHRADLFSLGAVLYEMLAGERAFRGTTSADTIASILEHDPPELSTARRPVPP